MTHQTLLVQLPITPGVLEAIPIPPGVQADSPVPGVGRTSSVTGHKTSAVSRPCISKTIAWRSWQNSEQNQSKHSKRLGQCEQAARSDYQQCSKQRSVQRLYFQQFQSRYLTIIKIENENKIQYYSVIMTLITSHYTSNGNYVGRHIRMHDTNKKTKEKTFHNGNIINVRP